MKILVTGGAGFIGSHVVDEYIKLGHKVCVIDDLSTGDRRNLNPAAKFYKMSVLSDKLPEVFKQEKPNLVNHHAAQKNLRFSLAKPMEDAAINILGSLNLLENCVRFGVKKFIFASSGGAIYGQTKVVPTPDDHAAQPLSPYGCAKLTIEHYLHYYHVVRGLKYIALRYANVYGPRQDATGEGGVVAIFANRLKAGESCVINGNGRQTRDFVYVKDVVSANVLALDGDVCGAYNVATSIETSVNELYRQMAAVLGRKLKAVHKPAKAGEQRRSALSYEKIKRLMGWRPTHTLSNGLDTLFHLM